MRSSWTCWRIWALYPSTSSGRARFIY